MMLADRWWICNALDRIVQRCHLVQGDQEDNAYELCLQYAEFLVGERAKHPNGPDHLSLGAHQELRRKTYEVIRATGLIMPERRHPYYD